MTKEEFNSLNTNDRIFAIEGYLDGFTAAIEVAQSVIQRIGDPTIDKMFISNRDSIVSILNGSLEKMKTSIIGVHQYE